MAASDGGVVVGSGTSVDIAAPEAPAMFRQLAELVARQLEDEPAIERATVEAIRKGGRARLFVRLHLRVPDKILAERIAIELRAAGWRALIR
jgi:hypothetical protein